MEPASTDPAAIRLAWKEWLVTAGGQFSLVDHALHKAAPPGRLLRQERVFLGRQIMYATEELSAADRAKAWRRLRDLFGADTGPALERVAWLQPLAAMAATSNDQALQREAESLLLSLSRSPDGEIRCRSISLFGDLPNATEPASPIGKLLRRLLSDPASPTSDRALAAWSLRASAKTDRDVVEQMLALAETFGALPEASFGRMTRLHCMGQVAGALSEASGKPLSLDPSEWRGVLKDWMAQLK